MLDLVVFFLEDLLGAALAIGLLDLAQLIFFGIWCLILLLPLVGVDRRDPIAMLMYVLFMMGAGAAFVFALPAEFIEQPSLKEMNITVVILGLVAGVRWFFRIGGKKKLDPEERFGES